MLSWTKLTVAIFILGAGQYRRSDLPVVDFQAYEDGESLLVACNFLFGELLYVLGGLAGALAVPVCSKLMCRGEVVLTIIDVF